MTLDPAAATVLAALITAAGLVFVKRLDNASKKREAELEAAATAHARRDADWQYLEASRDAAIEDVARMETRAVFAEGHLAICIAALRQGGLDVPPPPIPRT